MDKGKFEVILMMIVPDVVNMIVNKFNVSEIKAVNMFYNSSVYSYLEREDTKFWHYSPMTLFSLFEEEKETGSITFPEEAY